MTVNVVATSNRSCALLTPLRPSSSKSVQPALNRNFKSIKIVRSSEFSQGLVYTSQQRIQACGILNRRILTRINLISGKVHKISVERTLPDVSEQAERFTRVREAHKLEAIEDYVELIDDLISVSGEARLVDVANRMGISQPTASKTLARLQRDGYISSEPYRSIFLTTKGKQLADESRARHEVVYQFLLAIGVTKDVAKRDSEGIEHHVSEETLGVFQRLTESRFT